MTIQIPPRFNTDTPVSNAVDQDLRDWIGRAFGWASYADTTHTSGSPQSLTAATSAIFENDGGTVTSRLPAGTTQFWDGTTDRLVLDAVGDAWDLRITGTIVPASPNGTLDWWLDIGSDPLGGSSIPITQASTEYLKGTSAQDFVITVPGFALSTFLANGCAIVLNSSVNATIYNKVVFVHKDHSGETKPV